MQTIGELLARGTFRAVLWFLTASHVSTTHAS